MKRRTILTSGLAALTTLSIPGRRVFAAGTADVAGIGLDGKALSLKDAALNTEWVRKVWTQIECSVLA